jgi:hypothetical protein
MKRVGNIAIWLAGGLMLSVGARADDGVLPNNPYAPIVVRNIFALNPTQPVDPNATADPPPKITLNGIMSIFNHQLQVLFKVAPKAGQPGAKEESYILSEGQRQDEIEVIQIDEKAGLVTFNNHGTVQELPLVKANAPAVNTPTPPQGRPVPTPNLTAPNGENSGRIPVRFGGRSAGGPGAARNRGTGNGSNSGLAGGNNNSMGGGPAFNPVPTGAGYSGQTSQQSQNTMTAEEQMIFIAAQKLKLQQEGNPMATIYPPTPFDKEAGTINNAPPMPGSTSQ